MTHLSSASIIGSSALDMFVVILQMEELPQSPCENDRYCLKKIRAETLMWIQIRRGCLNALTQTINT